MSKAMAAEHYIYAQDESSARAAIPALSELGASVDVRESAYDESWLVLATIEAGNLEELHEIQPRIEAISESLGLEYDGWETAIE